MSLSPCSVLRCVIAAASAALLGCSSAPTPPLPDAGGEVVPPPSPCEPAPPVFTDAPVGWASVDALGQNGTTGGEGGEVVDVSTTAEFEAAAERSEPLVIRVSGTLGDGLRLKVASNKTILGVGERPTIVGSLEIEEVQNVIVRNLYVVGNNCNEDDGVCQSGADAVRIGDGAHHVWIDHCDVSDGSDGNLDVNGASDYVTISWTKFWYSSTGRGHRYSNLIGSGDGATGDRGKLKVTFDHCWWADNVQERMPRSRYGDVHVLNSYYSSRQNSYCIRAGVETRILAESSYFDHVTDPFDIENTSGIIESRNNYFDASPTSIATRPAFDPPYPYSAEPATSVPCTVSVGAGPHPDAF